MCYRGVKEALIHGGVIDSSERPTGGRAVDSMTDLPDLGLKDIYAPGCTEADDAPEGSILVYQWDGTPVPGIAVSNLRAGHIETKTTDRNGETQYCSDFCSSDPITTRPSSLRMVLAAVYVLPVAK